MPPAKTTPGLCLQQLLARGERPFPSYPQVARYFPAAAIEDARLRFSRAIERGDGPGLVVGAAGMGKSLLLQVLAAQFHERFDVVLLACAKLCTRRALLQAILFELGLPYSSRDEGPLRLRLLDHLLSAEQSPSGLLLLVDEAQSLSVPLLDELRVLTNLVRGGAPRVRLVLAGSTILEESFAHPELESLNQRLAARAYLAPFSRRETIQYVRAQIAASGGAADEVFAADAIDAVFEATDGVPRLVNQLGDRALLLAGTERHQRIEREVVQAAWADLQQMPVPWAATPTAGASPDTIPSSVVEFARLDDPAEDAPVGQLRGEPALADLEPTELDDDEDLPSHHDEDSPAAIHPDQPRAPRPTDDPFGEAFDEEEVVLDQFAAWDNGFTGRSPRVENARDRQFAARVHFAMTAGERPAVEPKLGPAAEPQPNAEFPGSEESPLEDETFYDDTEPNWPPIRLARMSESAPVEVMPLVARAPGIAAAAAFDCDLRDEPVLVIEDDAAPLPPRRPAACRENYRNLFSRLRSG